MTTATLSRSLDQRWSPRRWIMERVRVRRAPSTLPYVLEHRTIFVLPSRFGLGFGILLLFMALGGLNFNNNLALLLVFALGAVVQASTLLAYRNLRGLQVQAINAEPVFAGGQAVFMLHLGNPEPRARFAVMVGAGGGGGNSDCIDLAPQDTGQMRLSLATARRGWLSLPAIRLETCYPLGMFRAWSWLFPEARCLVYPAPAPSPPPLPLSGPGAQGQAKTGEGEQVHGLRDYHEGDSLRRVAWRTSARHDRLFTRLMETPREQSCSLSWQALTGRDGETRIAILAAWALEAERRQLAYSLELPGASIPPGLGKEHLHRCLEALALHGA